jgi:hypothetical protein
LVRRSLDFYRGALGTLVEFLRILLDAPSSVVTREERNRK